MCIIVEGCCDDSDAPEIRYDIEKNRKKDPAYEGNHWKTNLYFVGGKYESPLPQCALCLESIFCFWCLVGRVGAHLEYYSPEHDRDLPPKYKVAPDNQRCCPGCCSEACQAVWTLDTVTFLLLPQSILPLNLGWCVTSSVRTQVQTLFKVPESDCKGCLISFCCASFSLRQAVNEFAVAGFWHGSILTGDALEAVSGVTPPPHPHTRIKDTVSVRDPSAAGYEGEEGMDLQDSSNDNNINNNSSFGKVQTTGLAFGAPPASFSTSNPAPVVPVVMGEPKLVSPPHFNDVPQQEQQQGQQQEQGETTTTTTAKF